MATFLLLCLTLLISQSLSEKLLDRRRRGDPPEPPMLKAPDDHCGHQRCPPGYEYAKGRQEGVYMEGGPFVKGILCRNLVQEYHRGSGYPWWLVDPPFDWKPALRRCTIHEPKELGCELWGCMAYPKCRWGYTNYGCCFCNANCPGLIVSDPENFGAGTMCLLPCKSA